MGETKESMESGGGGGGGGGGGEEGKDVENEEEKEDNEEEEEEEEEDNEEEEEEDNEDEDNEDNEEEEEEEEEDEHESSVLSRVSFRHVSPTDIPTCLEIEESSYPEDEAASLTSLQYRQHHAAKYFRCAVLEDSETGESSVIGFICATRCKRFEHETMSTHDSSGKLLAIHSVVIAQQYRRQGIASAMLTDYLAQMKRLHDGVDKIVLMAKAHLLGFYVQSGFTVIRPSDIIHGQELWYDCEMDVRVEKGRNQGHSCWVVDAFAHKGGTGNPAAVVLLAQDVDLKSLTQWMQTVAKEFNLSETAFVWPMKHEDDHQHQQQQQQQQQQNEQQTHNSALLTADSNTSTDPSVAIAAAAIVAAASTTANQSNPTIETDDEYSITQDEPKDEGQQVCYGIRYFTSNGTEIDLCGHATLGSAAVLFAHLPFKVKNDVSIIFHTKHDRLVVTPYAEGNKTWTKKGNCMQIKMDFPQKALRELSDEQKISVRTMLSNAFPQTQMDILFMGLDQDGGDLLIQISEQTFNTIGHNATTTILYHKLDWSGYNRGVILCSKSSTPDIDFQSRFFAPKAGIDEDPVTGSAHCTLAPYFAAILNKTSMKAAQMSERGGIVDCILSDEDDRVTLIGSAITVMSGSIWI